MGLLAVMAEIASFSLLDRSTSDLRLMSFFALHALAAAMASGVAWRALPEHLRAPRLPIMGLLFSIGFFIPGLGVLATVIVINVATRFPKAITSERYVEIAEPQFTSTEKEKPPQTEIRVGYARRILRDPRQSVDTKLRVLIALQGMRPKVAIPLLQGLLGDPAEDIRLLAYSMMESWEKDITQRLQTAQVQLSAARELKEKTQTVNAHRRVAELYWEQVDTGLVRGDLRQYSLLQAKRHCEAALHLDANAGGVWLLFSAVLTELKETAAAHRTLLLARKSGIPDLVVLPMLARLAYDEGRYDEVAVWMKRTGRLGQMPLALRQVVRYWTRRSLDVQL
ncbi:MAG: hypothetical protein Q8N17_09640 [Burkholderiaceae bacterium]|nr:hypothetical protein [Burkholderiaceae bacterium]